jgi:hypothetical protein
LQTLDKSATSNTDWQQWWTISNQQHGLAAIVDNQQPTTEVGSNGGHWTISDQQKRLAAIGDNGQSATNNTDWQQW